MKNKVLFYRDHTERYNLEDVDDKGRFRNSFNYIRHSVPNIEIVYDIPDEKFIYEIETTEGPYWWLGVLNPDFPDLVHLIDIIATHRLHILEALQQDRCILHISQPWEGFPMVELKSKYDCHESRNFWHKLYDKLDYYNINGNQILYSTSNINESKNHMKYFESSNRLFEENQTVNIIEQNFFAEVCKHDFFFGTDKSMISMKEQVQAKKTHTFSCLNRMVRPHRLAFCSMLNYYNLLEGAQVSHALQKDEWYHNVKTNAGDYSYHPAFHEKESKEFYDLLPLELDQTDFSINQAQNFFKQTYLDTNYSVITETYFNEFEQTSRFFSEKIFKPMRAHHPFVMVGQHHALKVLKDLGFKTFDLFWSEEYDNIVDSVDRMTNICFTIQNLNEKTSLEWKKIYQNSRMQEILEHNYNHLVNTQWVNYGPIMEKLFD